MKKTILIILTASLTCIGYSQTAFLDNYNFEEGGYSLLGTFSVSDPGNELADSLGEWYTDDISVLNEFKKEWIFNNPSPMYLCGYHYIVYVCKNGQPLENFSINLNCNEIVGDKGYFYFETSKLRVFKDKLKKPRRQSKDFENIIEARNYRNEILKDEKLIMTPTPDWTTFEGSFSFDYSFPDDYENHFDKADSLLAIIRKQIERAYPGEKFALEEVGGSDEDMEVRINCDNTLNKRFNLYPRSWRTWDYFKLELIAYWKN